MIIIIIIIMYSVMHSLSDWGIQSITADMKANDNESNIVTGN